MPLVWELTSELKALLTAENLNKINKSWRVKGGGFADSVIADLLSILDLPHVHYESVLGYLETQFHRDHGQRGRDYYNCYSWLIEQVYNILYFRHTNNASHIEAQLRFLDGIVSLARANRPLWVFTLNHDLIIECVAARNHLEINSGFADQTVAFPRRNKSGEKIGQVSGDVMLGSRFATGLPFFRHGKEGINLLKIHGALDVFTFNDGNDLIKLRPSDNSVQGVLQPLREANEELVFIHPTSPEQPAKSSNMITYADDQGEMQFLRRSLLSGAYKFADRNSQNLPVQFLDLFRTHVNYITHLVCVGYGFFDNHINLILRQWLEFSAQRTLVIVSPRAADIPSGLLHLAPQVKLVAASATDYFDSIGNIIRSKQDLAEKRLAAWMRKQRRGSESGDLFLSFTQDYIMDRTRSVFESLPIRDGRIDLQTLGLSEEDFLRKATENLNMPIEDMINAFLDSQKEPS